MPERALSLRTMKKKSLESLLISGRRGAEKGRGVCYPTAGTDRAASARQGPQASPQEAHARRDCKFDR